MQIKMVIMVFMFVIFMVERIMQCHAFIIMQNYVIFLTNWFGSITLMDSFIRIYIYISVWTFFVTLDLISASLKEIRILLTE